VKLVDEPKGALLCHLWHKDFSPDDARKGILVVDFGGGTCDFAFLRCLEVCHSWETFTWEDAYLTTSFFNGS